MHCFYYVVEDSGEFLLKIFMAFHSFMDSLLLMVSIVIVASSSATLKNVAIMVGEGLVAQTNRLIILLTR